MGKPQVRSEEEQLSRAVIEFRDDDGSADAATTLEQTIRRPGNVLVLVAEAVGIQIFIAQHKVKIAMELVRATPGGLRNQALSHTYVSGEVVRSDADFRQRIRIWEHRSLVPCSTLDRNAIQLNVVAAKLPAIDTHRGHVATVRIPNSQGLTI